MGGVNTVVMNVCGECMVLYCGYECMGANTVVMLILWLWMCGVNTVVMNGVNTVVMNVRC